MTSTDGKRGPETEGVDPAGRPAGAIRGFRLQVMAGPAKGMTYESTSDRCSIGSDTANDLLLEDPTVSRFHCEIAIDAREARVRDLGSKNGTMLDGVRIADGYLRTGSVLVLGRSIVSFEFGNRNQALQISSNASFGALIGTSVKMRRAYALLERAASSEATVLLEGESGTGKEVAAESLHDASRRREGPFVVVDCGAIPPTLLESELFGHEKGAFTGALAAREGVFESASGGTIFLDEIGELPIDLQPRLLRVLEQREIRRVGASTYKPVDVRVVAATHRDLRALVNEGRFRHDLYYRLAVVRITLPPLREHPEDIPALAGAIVKALGADAASAATLAEPAFVVRLQAAAWPGNVRELRNYLERCLVLQEAIPLGATGETPTTSSPRPDVTIPYEESRRRNIDEWERAYLAALRLAHAGGVAQAAKAAGISRVTLWRLIQKHGMPW